jgi:hypothetical protein
MSDELQFVVRCLAIPLQNSKTVRPCHDKLKFVGHLPEKLVTTAGRLVF